MHKVYSTNFGTIYVCPRCNYGEKFSTQNTEEKGVIYRYVGMPKGTLSLVYKPINYIDKKPEPKDNKKDMSGENPANKASNGMI